MMTDQTAITTNTVVTAPSVSAAPASTIPQVGDAFRSGVIMGVRKYAVGGCDITLNGVDWIPYQGDNIASHDRVG